MKAIVITEKKTLGPAMHVMQCPKCGRTVASAAEKAWLPYEAYCDHTDKVRSTKALIKRK